MIDVCLMHLLPKASCYHVLCVHIHVVARTNSCKNVVLQGCGKLQSAISYFLTTTSSQMNVEAADDVDKKY